MSRCPQLIVERRKDALEWNLVPSYLGKVAQDLPRGLAKMALYR